VIKHIFIYTCIFSTSSFLNTDFSAYDIVYNSGPKYLRKGILSRYRWSGMVCVPLQYQGWEIHMW